MAVAVALPGGRVKVVDVYGNDLIEFQTENGEEVIQIRSHPSHATEDCYLAALTDQDTFYTFYFELRRDPNWKQMDATFKRLEKGLGPIAEPTTANTTAES